MAGDGDWGAAFAGGAGDAMRAYEDTLVRPMFEPWAELLLDRVGVGAGSGSSVLDVATGPGTVARLAAARVGPSGRVTGCDISPAMLAVARRKPPVEGGATVEYVECPADALRVGDASFDAVTCQHGVQFFPDRVAGLAEMRRAARHGGRVGVAVWRAIDECAPFAAVARAIGRVLGDDVAAAYRAGPWGFGDPDELAALGRAAGLGGIDVQRHELPVVFEDGPVQLVRSLAATPVGPQVATLDDAGRAALLAAAEDELSPMVVDGQVRSSLAANLLTATA